MRRLVLASLIALCIPIGTMTPAQGHGFENCTEGRRRVSNLKKDHTTCDKARSVARRYDRHRVESESFPPPHELVGRFHCYSDRTGLETWKIRCRKGAGEHAPRVRFDWGV
jgi:hypothetical protein